MRTAIRLLLGLAAGLMVGAFGTAIHRTIWGAFELHDAVGRGFPVGLLVALALTVCAALFIRAAAGFNTYAAFGIGWILAVQLLAMPGRAGDVLLVDPRAEVPWAMAGLIWTYLGALLLILIALLPARWFRSIPERTVASAGLAPNSTATEIPNSVVNNAANEVVE